MWTGSPDSLSGSVFVAETLVLAGQSLSFPPELVLKLSLTGVFSVCMKGRGHKQRW